MALPWVDLFAHALCLLTFSSYSPGLVEKSDLLAGRDDLGGLFGSRLLSVSALPSPPPSPIACSPSKKPAHKRSPYSQPGADTLDSSHQSHLIHKNELRPHYHKHTSFCFF